MKDTKFIQCALRLKCDTGSDLETVGLCAEHDGTAIRIYGDKDTGHELRVSEFAIFDGKEWKEDEPTDSQRAALAAILAKEVDRLRYEREAEDFREELNDKRSNEVLRFGFEGGIYGQLN